VSRKKRNQIDGEKNSVAEDLNDFDLTQQGEAPADRSQSWNLDLADAEPELLWQDEKKELHKAQEDSRLKSRLDALEDVVSVLRREQTQPSPLADTLKTRVEQVEKHVATAHNTMQEFAKDSKVFRNKQEEIVVSIREALTHLKNQIDSKSITPPADTAPLEILEKKLEAATSNLLNQIDKINQELRSQEESSFSKQLLEIESETKKLRLDLDAMKTQASPEKSAPFKSVETPTQPSNLSFDLNKLLDVVIKHKASDLHIKPGTRPIARLDGELVAIGNVALTEADTHKLILEGMPESARARLSQQGYVDYAYTYSEARFRINVFRQQSSLCAAIRFLRLDIPTFDELMLPSVLEKISRLNNGLVLVTGPAGTGKSTTLAAIIESINKTQRKHVITIEDPIEFVYTDKESFITQCEIGTDAPNFSEALKRSLRQDPNVLLIGEMRDADTIWTAAMAAETGHLVFSTLHTPNTIQAINRIIDVFPGDQQRQFRSLLAHTLRAVVSQRLLPRADRSGRIVAVEVMIVTPTIASLIADGTSHEIYEYITQGTHEGMQTFTESLTKLYQSGLITKEAALYYAEHPTEFRLGVEGYTSGSSQMDWSMNA